MRHESRSFGHVETGCYFKSCGNSVPCPFASAPVARSILSNARREVEGQTDKHKHELHEGFTSAASQTVICVGGEGRMPSQYDGICRFSTRNLKPGFLAYHTRHLQTETGVLASL